MKLEINREDKKANLQTLKKKGKRLLIAGLSSLILFSGSYKTVYAQTSEPTELDTMMEDESSVVDIPESYLYEVLDSCGKEKGDEITKDDLAEIGKNSVFNYFTIEDNSSLNWLNYCSNIKNLTLMIQTDNLDCLQDIKNLPNLNTLKIYPTTNVTLTKEDTEWIKNCSKLKELDLLGCHVEPGLLESLTNIQKLGLMDESSQEVDYEKLTFLQELEFLSDEPYEIAIGFSKSDYETLVNKGVKVSFQTEETKNKVLEINERLEEIVKSLNLSENSTDQEKLNAILIYVLDNLSYDEEVAKAVSQNLDCKSLSDSFYEGGDLYGALEKDSAICGNYAALVEALAKRTNLDTHLLESSNHAWNVVKVEGDYYYVDATWLDSTGIQVEKQEDFYDENGNRVTSITWDQIPAQEAIKDGRVDELEWYMEDPVNYKKETGERKESHDAVNLPDYITLKPITEKDVEGSDLVKETPVQQEETTAEEEQIEENNVEKQKFELKIGNKKWIIGGAVLVGIMTALGSAVAINKKREKKRKERIRRQYSGYSNTNSDNNYRHFK